MQIKKERERLMSLRKKTPFQHDNELYILNRNLMNKFLFLAIIIDY